MTDRKFSLEEILNSSTDSVTFNLKKEFTKQPKKRGGPAERNSLLRAIIESHEMLLRNQKQILEELARMRK